MKTQKINKNKVIKIFIAFSLILSSIDSSAWRVHKHRDQFRIGYGIVQECTFYEATSNGNLVITIVEINCRLEGDLICRRAASNISPPANDLEQCDEFTAAEKTVGINILVVTRSSVQPKSSSKKVIHLIINIKRLFSDI